MTEQKLFEAAGGRFIDPKDCGSMIRWIVEVWGKKPNPDHKSKYMRAGHTRIDASVGLADCSRRIEWDMGGKENDKLAKLDAAIAELEALRAALVGARAASDRFIKKHDLDKQKEDDDE